MELSLGMIMVLSLPKVDLQREVFHMGIGSQGHWPSSDAFLSRNRNLDWKCPIWDTSCCLFERQMLAGGVFACAITVLVSNNIFKINGIRYLRIMYLTEDLYCVYIKNNLSSTVI